MSPRGADGVGAQIPTLITLIAAELANGSPGSAATVARLTDVLVLHMIRHHVEHLTDADTGWLRAMSDPQISQAIGLIHNKPAQPWTAAGLAREVGLSRSAFFGRFRHLVGEGPIEYLTRWRMHIASHQLRDGESVGRAGPCRRLRLGSELLRRLPPGHRHQARVNQGPQIVLSSLASIVEVG